jgi:hypothetical protein
MRAHTRVRPYKNFYCLHLGHTSLINLRPKDFEPVPAQGFYKGLRLSFFSRAASAPLLGECCQIGKSWQFENKKGAAGMASLQIPNVLSSPEMPS